MLFCLSDVLQAGKEDKLMLHNSLNFGASIMVARWLMLVFLDLIPSIPNYKTFWVF